jgi:glutamate dehydrogenase (NAD(P)+)
VYTDPLTESRGFLAYDGLDCRLAAGGCRIQPGLTAETLIELAGRMTLKQRVLGLNVDGAKCGLDYDPTAPDSEQVLARFLEFLRPELVSRFSMGCDMGTRFDQLERVARSIGIPSVKGAVQTAQGLTDREFHARMRLLDARVGRYTLSQRRAGHALAAAARTAARHAGLDLRNVHVGLQGFGTLGRAAACSFEEWGISVTAIGDEHGCVVDPHGLDIARMLEAEPGRPVLDMLGQPLRLSPSALCQLPLDVLVLAGADNGITPEQAEVLPVPVVVVGANCGVRPEAARILTERGILVVPDFIGGCGGSASMEALFGPARTPSPEDVLDLVETLVTELVTDVLDASRSRGLPPSQVAHDIAAAAAVYPDRPPYGNCPYLSSGPPPRGNRAGGHRSSSRGVPLR